LKRIVCDTGPLLHLREADSLDIVEALGSVAIPPMVYSELIGLDLFWREEKPAWVNITALDPSSSEASLRWMQAGLLDPGEAQALALALQITADWLLTDDAAARLVAQQHGLEVHGSLGVILWGAATGRLLQTEAEKSLEALSRSSLWISARILEEARTALRQIFS
jgi:predicted nucleic acid-binding protein